MNIDEHSLPQYKEYEDSLVAFIDILGFAKRVEEIQNSTDFFEIGKLLYAAKKTADSFNNAGELFENFMFTVISDSIIVTVPFKDPICATGLVTVLQNLQYELLATGFETIIRGYISRGPVYHENGLIFGAGYIEAYRGEKNIGSAPRIVLCPSIIEQARKIVEQYSDKEDMVSIFDYIKEDRSDGFYFIDYLKSVGVPGTLPTKQFVAERNSIETFIEKSLIKFKKDYRILPKYMWLKNYFKESSSYNKNA